MLEAREQLADLSGKVQCGQEDVTIRKHGKPVAIPISVETMAYFEQLEAAERAREVALSCAVGRLNQNAENRHQAYAFNSRTDVHDTRSACTPTADGFVPSSFQIREISRQCAPPAR